MTVLCNVINCRYNLNGAICDKDVCTINGGICNCYVIVDPFQFYDKEEGDINNE